MKAKRSGQPPRYEPEPALLGRFSYDRLAAELETIFIGLCEANHRRPAGYGRENV